MTLDDQKGQTVITCDGPMEVDYGRRKARFWRNVLVKDAKGSIRSDRMDIALEEKTDQIRKATFWGHVKMWQENRLAYAHRAHYWQPQGRTRLVGHPRMVMLAKDE